MLAFAPPQVTVTPVVNKFVATPAQGQTINFVDYGPPSTGLQGLRAAQPPLVNGQLSVPGITFESNTIGNNVQFVQNVLGVANGINDDGAAWEYADGSQWQSRNVGTKPNTSFPYLDSKSGKYYPSVPTINNDGSLTLKAEDSPGTGYPDHADEIRTIDYEEYFKIWLVATFSDGTVYGVAHINWEVNFFATVNTPGKGVTYISTVSGITAHGMVKEHEDPETTDPPLTNVSIGWQFG